MSVRSPSRYGGVPEAGTLTIRDSITTLLAELFGEDDLVLLETELDSLGYAVLVTRLEEQLGFDPFSMMDEPVYPTTLGEFIGVYEQHAPAE